MFVLTRIEDIVALQCEFFCGVEASIVAINPVGLMPLSFQINQEGRLTDLENRDKLGTGEGLRLAENDFAAIN